MTPSLFLQDGDCLPCDAWGSLFAFGSKEEGERAAYSNDNGGCVKHVAHAGEGGEDSSKQETEEAENGRGVSGVFPFQFEGKGGGGGQYHAEAYEQQEQGAFDDGDGEVQYECRADEEA